MGRLSSLKQFRGYIFPLSSKLALVGAGFGNLRVHPRFEGAGAAVFAHAVLAHAAAMSSIAVGLVVVISAWLLQNSNARARELQAANQALSELNEQLKHEVENVLQSDEKSRLLFCSNPCPMLVLDCNTLAITDANDAAQQLYGYSHDELIQLQAIDIRPPEERTRFKSFMQQQDSGYGARGSWTHRRKDGSDFPVEIHAFRFVHAGALRDLVLVQDVSASFEAEQAVLRSEAALKSMFDNAPFGICCSSMSRDCMLDFNPAAAEMLGGYTRGEALALKLSTQLYSDPLDRDRMLELLRRGKKVNAFETTLLRKDGSPLRVRTWGVLRSKPGETPDLLDVYVEDITDHSKLEQQVRQVQKLEAVGRLAGGIAHDFNNILVVIRLSTELMLGKVTHDSPLSKPLLQVLNASDRAASLTRQLLAFGRQQVMQARTINLNGIVSDTLRLLRRTIGEDIELVTNLDAQLRNTRLDPDQLAQVIMNLAINSRDAMPGGGSLEIETRNVDLDAAYARAHDPVQPGKYVMLAVTDSGTGIDAALIPRIFDPFFTTKELGKGTGLGLSIVYGIVKQSGGYIWVYSEPGRGTTFKVYFPVTDSQPEAEPELPESQVMTGDKTVLVVEDEVQIRQNLGDCLRQLGCHVVEARDGIEAIERFHEHHGKIDLVLTDLVMPRMSGHELWTQLTNLDPQLSFLFMSGYTEDSAMRRAILGRQSIFLNKPFSVADLSSGIQRALALRSLQQKSTLSN